MNRKIKTPAWVNGRTIYEVNLRQYTAEGSFKSFEAHLPRLKEMGVGILWFMPIHPIGLKNRKGSLGSYYSIADYSAVNSEFGSLEEFRSLVKKIHQLDMKVIIDWVANHTAWDHHWTLEHPDFYSRDEKGNFKAPVPDWEDVIHLDYGNPDLWDEMIDQMCFWLRETEIDGFRCDMAHLVPTLFWNRARRELDKIRPVYMLAESENHDLLEYAFDSLYNWKMLHLMNRLAKGEINGASLISEVLNEFEFLPEGARTLNFTSNHDENSWQGSAIERLHFYLEPLIVFSFLIQGNPLIYSGQEAGNYQRLNFFDKDLIPWKEDKLFSLFQKLTQIHKVWLDSETKMLTVENDANGNVLTFEIKNSTSRLFALINLSPDKQAFYIQCKDFEGEWFDLVKDRKESINCKELISLEAYQYRVLNQ